jgi:hypothetical protein
MSYKTLCLCVHLLCVVLLSLSLNFRYIFRFTLCEQTGRLIVVWIEGNALFRIERGRCQQTL